MTRVFHNLCVFIQSALSYLEWRNLPFLPSSIEFLVTDVNKINSVLDGINGNGVSIMDESDGPACLSFGNNMTNYEAVRANAELELLT